MIELAFAFWLLAHDHSDPNWLWYENRVDAKGRSCCANNDWGRPTDWRRVREGDKDIYQILFREAWIDVPDDAVLTGTAPDGVPTVWSVLESGKLLIRCFVPGAEG